MEVLDATIDALEAAGIPYGIMGGLASASLGRPRWTHDIDCFVRPDTAGAALEALERAGFTTQRTNAYWLFKGIRDAVLVDVLFQSRTGSPSTRRCYPGRRLRARLEVPPAAALGACSRCSSPPCPSTSWCPEAVLQSLFETIIGHPGSDGRRGEQALSVTAAARGKPV